MGVYLYTFKNSPRKVRIKGVIQNISPMSFVTKLFYENTRKDKRTAKAAQERFENAQPEFLVMDTFQENNPVFSNPTKVYWFDTDKFPGIQIGVLKKNGRSWEVV